MNDCIKTIGYSVLCKLTNKLTNKNQRKAISASIFLQLKHHRLTQPPKYNKKSDLTQTAKPRQNNKERANLQAYQIQAECYFPSSLLLQANVCREMFFSAKIMSAFPLISICPEHQNFTKFHQLHNTVWLHNHKVPPTAIFHVAPFVSVKPQIGAVAVRCWSLPRNTAFVTEHNCFHTSVRKFRCQD